MVNLYFNYYYSDFETRQSELEYCFMKNLNNKFIDNLFVIISERDIDSFEFKDNKINLIIHERPTFSEVLEMISIRTGEDDINIIVNSDCFLDYESSNFINLINNEEMWCLNKYDIIDVDFNLNFIGDSCSQDAWAFRGFPKKVKNIDFNFGLPGCDNRFAFESQSCGYILRNPSLDFKIIHYHLSGVRSCSYESWSRFRINGNYRMVNPEKIKL